jgi:hypothetical protein
MSDTEVTFEQLNGLRFNTSAVHREPITDFKMVAGLLFRRWNDGTSRWIKYRKNEPISILHIRTEQNHEQFEVLATCVETLDDLAMLDRDLGNVCEVCLSQSGEKTVVHEWFGNTASVLDRIATTVPERY